MEETVAVVADSIASNGGNIRISENVIASVVKKYTLETPGVIRFVTTSLVSGFANAKADGDNILPLVKTQLGITQ